MRASRVRKLLSCASLLLLMLAATASAWAQAATLGRGLEQMVQLYEFGNPKLNDVLKLHLTTSADNVMVHVRLTPGATTDQVLPLLTLSGFQLQAKSDLDPGLLEGYLPLGSARAAAAVAGVRSILAVQRPRHFAGTVQSQAVAVQKADLAQARGIDGTGTKLGALSDSYNSQAAVHPNAADDVASGDLPSGVVVLEDLGPGDGADEGRAMLQLVHDIAPGSGLAFATAFNGLVDFSNNILNLRRQFGADVIVDDVIYFAEPMYSDGLLAQTVDEVVKSGAAYFSSAGNNGLEGYEADYSSVSFHRAEKLVAEGKSNLDLAALVAWSNANQLPVPKSFHNFKTHHFTVFDGRDGRHGGDDDDWGEAISQRFTSYFGDVVDFQWDEPFDLGKVKTDYNIYVFDAAGHFIDPNDPTSDAFFTTDDNTLTDEAVELFAVNAGSYQVVIGKMNHGPARRLKYVCVNGTGESERQNAPTVWGHAAARHGQAVAAMFYPITNFPEDYSSPGPTTIFFDKFGDRLHEPEIRPTPQITAVDGADTTFFIPGFDIEPNGFPNFFGTSAAAPDAAAVALLVIQSAGGPGHIRPKHVYRRMQKTATPFPLSRNRVLAAADADPVLAFASGDFPRETNFWRLAVDRHSSHTVNSVSINLTTPDMHWSNPASPTTGFHIGETKGLLPTDVSATRSADLTTLTLTFKPGTFGAGDELTFANFAFPVLLPVQFEVDADRVAGGLVTVTLDDATTSTGTFRVEKLVAPNPFTGAGLVNADAATKPGHHYHHDDKD
jgi:hypothetical protein